MSPVADPTLALERRLLGRQDGLIIGCDEVGRGALAGPVAVGICVVEVRRSTRVPKGLRDSKMLSEARREVLAPVAGSWGVAHAVGYASADEIDRIGITACLGLAGARALAEIVAAGIDVSAVPVILDGHFDWLSRAVPHPLTVHTQIKGDRDCASVAAASVISKVARDRLMVEHDGVHPAYGWARNKGYGSEEHRSAILSLGPTDLHRHTWLSGVLAGETSVMLDGFEEAVVSGGGSAA